MGDVELGAEQTPTAARPLAYKPEGGTVSVRGFRLLLVLTLLNTTLLGVVVLGPQLFPFLREQWTHWRNERAARQSEAAALQAALVLQQQAANYAISAGTLVYDEHPESAAMRLREGGTGLRPAWGTAGAPTGWVPAVQAVAPKVIKDYHTAVYRTGITTSNLPLLFLHERMTPGGQKYVVAVHMQSSTHFGSSSTMSTSRGPGREVVTVQSKVRELIASAFPAGPDGPAGARSKVLDGRLPLVLPDTAEREVQRASVVGLRDQPLPVDYGNVMRFYAGQPDANDPTHFTIPFTLDGRDGVIDGWLKDDAVELKPREGEWIFDGGERWRLTPPTTRPLVYPSTTPANQ